MRGVRWMILCLVLLGACEREGQPRLWRAPKVGDRGSAVFAFTANLEGPDGKAHTLTHRNEFTSSLLALDAEFPTKVRMTFVRNEAVFDGVAKPGISGSFEVTTTGDVVDVTRVDGRTLTPEERAFFTSTHRPSRTTTAAGKRFAQQSFKVGQVIVLTPDEIIGLGFGMSSIELTVTEVTSTQVVFKIKSSGEMAGMSGSMMNSAGTLRMFEGGRELAQDGEVFQDGKHMGTVHVELRSRAL
jgi:hypothetical protein